MSPSRHAVNAEGCEHATPIPTASRVGPLLASSVIAPYDIGTRSVPTSVTDQVANVFERAGRILDVAGAAWGDIARMTFFVLDASSRDAIDEAWTTRFPDPATRPARATLTVTLPAPMEVQCEFLALVTT